jgi:glycosyltransferase involved in cell wall biosynthesis
MIPKENRPLLLIIGNGREYRKECETFIAKNSLEAYTRIETNIHNNQLLQALYTRALVFIYPSFYEGFGLPVVEAALQQTPVITTTVSSLPEAAGPDACLIDPHASDAAEQMARHIDSLCGDRALAKSTGQKMEAYARRMFTPETLTRQVMKLYEAPL